jgi:hypothetical protein
MHLTSFMLSPKNVSFSMYIGINTLIWNILVCGWLHIICSKYQEMAGTVSLDTLHKKDTEGTKDQ